METFALTWKDYKNVATGMFSNLFNDKDFTDVTLVCEDGKQVEAHKVILANSSPFFQNLLRKNKHIHPLIYMRGVKSDDLLAIVDFLYCGEANVFQENLDSFLAIAEELQLKGLMGKMDEKVEDFNVDDKSPPSKLSTSTSTNTKIPQTSSKLSSKPMEIVRASILPDPTSTLT